MEADLARTKLELVQAEATNDDLEAQLLEVRAGCFWSSPERAQANTSTKLQDKVLGTSRHPGSPVPRSFPRPNDISQVG